MDTDKVIIRIQETLNGSKRLLIIMKENEENKQICRLSKKKLSEVNGLSYTGTCKKLHFLLRYGIVKQVNGGFVSTGRDALSAKPFTLLPKIMLLVLDKPGVYSSFKLQAELLNESLGDIQTAWGFYSYFSDQNIQIKTNLIC